MDFAPTTRWRTTTRFNREYVVQEDSEYADGGHPRQHLREPPRSVKNKLTPYFRAFHLRRELYKNQLMKHSNMLSTPFSENQQRVYKSVECILVVRLSVDK